MLQAIICPCGTARLNLVDFLFEVGGIGGITYGKILYDLRVVDASEGIIANLVRVPFRKFHDGELDFLLFIRDFRVLGCGAVNKGIDSVFQRVHAFCVIAFAHDFIHTAGGIQHHDNIQGLRIGGGGRRIGGQRRQRDQEISVFIIFGHCDRVLARQDDLVFLHRFVGPDTACGKVVVALRILPRIKRVGVAGGC